LAAHIGEKESGEREEARKILRNQLLVEGELISLYEKAVQDIPNALVQQMLRMIRHDSQKHVMMLGVIVDFLDGKEVFMQDRKGLADSLKRHLELEKESIQNGELLLNHEWLRDRKGYRTIIESWVEDEKRHHRFLKELSDNPFTPISSGDLFSALRNEEFFEERYKRSKAYWNKVKETSQ
jgi:rubrerythrin